MNKQVWSYAMAALLLLALATSERIAAMSLKVGDGIPEFKLPYATKDTLNMDGLSSSELSGKRYMLAVYPADWSGGCTKEMCSFRDAITQFESLKVEVLPISADLVYSHREWAKQHNLPFRLLADQTREFGKKLGVYLEDKGMFKRSVFVVGPDGKLEYIDYDYSVADDNDFSALRSFLSSVKK